MISENIDFGTIGAFPVTDPGSTQALRTELDGTPPTQTSWYGPIESIRGRNTRGTLVPS